MTKTVTFHILSSAESYLYILLFICFSSFIQAQGTIQVTVTNGDAETTCGGFLGFDPVVQWSVDIENEGEVIYPVVFGCFNDFPNVQYMSSPQNCFWNNPSSLEICFKAFENEGLFCNVNEDCTETICEEFIVPINSGEVIEYTLSLPENLESSGFVTFEIEILGEYIGDSNDDPCTALEMGVIETNSSLGSNNLSQFNNSCANLGGLDSDPAPGYPNITDNQGLWFQFETSDDFIDLLSIKAISDPENLGDPVNLQMVLYEMQGGNCSVLQYLNSEDDLDANDIVLYQNCVPPNTTFVFLIDGTFDSGAGVEGYFDVQITAETVQQAPNLICDAENLGTIPDGGNVGSDLWTNNCADAIGDPTPNQFNINQSVWFQFTAPPSGHVIINTLNHMPMFGNEIIDLQLALFESNDNTCSGDLTEVNSVFENNSSNQTLNIQCLEADQPYWILVDGATDIISAAFDISVEDGGIFPPEVDNILTICDESSYNIGINSYNSAGTYLDTLVANNGCDSIVTTILSIADPLEMSIEQFPATLEDTFDGSATTLVSGGISPYSYQWSNGANTPNIENVLAGNYCVTITDNIGCAIEDCVDIFFLGAVMATATTDLLDCFGDQNGLITLMSSGATAPYSFEWENLDNSTIGSGTIDLDGGSTIIENLSAGTYSITINGSVDQFSIITTTVAEPNLITSNIEPVLCFGDSLGIGINTYTQAGDYIDTLNSVLGCDSIVFSNITFFEENIVDNSVQICAGSSYEIGNSSYTESGFFEDILQDNQGCDSIVMTTLEVLDSIQINIVPITLSSGYQIQDGTSEIFISGGNGNYSINWQDGSNQNTITDLEGGSNVCVTVTDELTCTSEWCTFIPYSGENLASVVPSDVVCNGATNGQIQLNSNLGLPPYTFEWEALDDSNSGSGMFDNQFIISDLAANEYQITVTDANNISSILSTTINQPPPIELNNLSIQNPTCTDFCDGFLAFEVTGGTGNYIYNWTNSNLVGNSGSNLCTQDYALTIIDENGCEALQFFIIENPEPLAINIAETAPVNCFDGSDGQASVTSNADIATILWDNGENTPLATQLDAGVHSVTISDTNGCSSETTIDISEPDSPVGISLEIQSSISCNGFDDGIISSNISGPGTDFSYDWSLLNSINSFSANDSIISNLNAGAYEVMVTNESGCSATENIELVEPDPLGFTVTSIDATCLYDGNSGTITVQNPIGGTNPYLFSLENEGFNTSNVFENVPTGNYTVTVQDVEGCETENTIEVAPPPTISVTAPENMEINLGESIEVAAFSPNSNVSLTWTTNETILGCEDNCENITLSPAVSTFYEVTATDSISMCSETFDFLIEVDAQRNIYFPNAFTPNNDGVNDYFIPYGELSFEKVTTMMIFDRSGNQVFQLENFSLEDQTIGWQGIFRNQELPQGVYVYLAEIEFKDGVSIQYKGDVTLMR